MIRKRSAWQFLSLVALWVTGCSGGGSPSAPPRDEAATAAAKAQFLLPAEPEGAQNVVEVRQQAKDGDPVVMVGKIGGHKKPLGDGRASFMIVDLSLRCDDEKCFDFS